MSPSCSVPGCDYLPKTKGMCQSHYMRLWSTGDVQADRPVRRQRKNPEPCAVPGCQIEARIGPHCAPHGRRKQRTGDVQADKPLRKQAGNGQGRPSYENANYRMVKAPGHPNAYGNGYALEHVVVMTEVLGRPLVKGENVHHKNGVRTDNRPENLELWVTRQPKGQRAADLLAWAEQLVALYGPVRDRLG